MVKKRKWFNGLKPQIALLYMVASSVTITFIGLILYFSISNVIMNETLERTKMAVDNSGVYIESYIDKIKDISYIITNNPATIKYLSSSDGIQEGLSQEVDVINSLIKTGIESDPYIKSIIIVGKKGQLLSNEDSLDMSMSEDMMKEQWYKNAVHSGSMPVLTSARMQKFDMDKDQWVISLSREIVDASGANIGVMVVDFDYSVIESYLETLKLGVEGYSFILNQEGEVVYHPDTSYYESSDKGESLILICELNSGYDNESQRLYHKYKLENANWILSGVASLDELIFLRRQMLETMLIVGILGLIVLMGMTTYITGRVTNPIEELEKAMSGIEEELNEIELKKSGCNEAVSLAWHYNEMIRKIQNLMEERTKQEQAIKVYELNVLHSQINPHFLYNTLDTIVWMAEFDDSEKVVEITQSLARFFRLSLSGGSEETTIGNEIEHVKQYLFIQKERYRDKLNYVMDVPEAIKSVIIPKIILQPIVENAIYHGIKDMDGNGLIRIKAVDEGEVITIIIEDNGIGYEIDSVDKDSHEDDGVIKLGGVGLKNVDQRLKLAYGEEFGLKVESEVGKGTIVTLRLGKILKKAYN